MKNLNEYIETWDGLLALVTDQVTEDSHLDFKRDAYSNPLKPQDKREADKDELRRDATSLANGGGGVLLIGVDEDAQGRAGGIPGIENAVAHEGFVRDVLSRSIEPPFTGTALQVRTIPNQDKEASGVVVVKIGASEPNLPHAVLKADAPLDFWIRIDKSKRRMAYLQLRASFRSGEETITQQGVDALAISEVYKIGYALGTAHKNEKKELELLEQLRFHVGERGYGYGHRVRMEVMEAAGRAVEYPRSGVSVRTARSAIAIVEAALPFFHMWAPAQREITKDEQALLQLAETYGHALAYDGAKYLKNLRIIAIGGNLMGKLLRVAHLNGLNELQEELIDDFKVARELAEERDLHDAVQVLDYQRDSAFENRKGPYVPEPKGLEWVIFGLDEPNAQSSSGNRSREKQKSVTPKSTRRNRPRSK